MTTKKRTRIGPLLIGLFSVMLAVTGCSGSSGKASSQQVPLMRLTGVLHEVVEHLSGTFSIYDTDDVFVDSGTLSFTDDGEGGTEVRSSEVTLKRATTYRFVVLFLWDGVPISYVNSIQTTDDLSSTTITFDEGSITYGPPSGLSASESDSLTADISAGILPDLDLDDDGYTNFVELRAGSDPNDSSSIPSGPVISDFTAALSADGNTLTLSATVADRSGVTDVGLIFDGADYLQEVLTETSSGESGDTTREYSAEFNPQYAPVGDLTITLTSTNDLGLESSDSLATTITDNGTNVGPVIVFESVAEGDVLAGTATLSLRAYDRDGTASVELDEPAGLTNSSTADDRFVTDWDTTDVADGEYTLNATATDETGLSSSRTLDVTIGNGSDTSGPNIALSVYESDNDDAVFDYQNGEEVYGEIGLYTLASDPSGVDSLALFNFSSFGGMLGTASVSTATTYINTLDTTELSDGVLTLKFLSADSLGNSRTRTFSLTVANHPSVSSFTVEGSTSLTTTSSSAVTLAWSADDADDVSITNVETGVTLLSGLGITGSQTATLSSSGTYRLTATRRTNLEDFTDTSDVTVNIDDDSDGVINESDCDDNDPLAYPGATEVPYDGIDQDCSGADLTDVDGDGYDSTAVSGGTDCNDSNAAVHPGVTEKLNDMDDDCDGTSDHFSLSLADAAFIGENAGDSAGYPVSSAGDVDSDSFADILVGAPGDDTNGAGAGKAYLIYGAGSGLTGNIDLSMTNGVTFVGQRALEYTGSSLAAAGDVDGDAYDDILIGAYGYGGSGNDYAVYLMNGGEDFGVEVDFATPEGLDYDPNWNTNLGTKIVAESFDDTGFSVAGAGDVDGDGYADILITGSTIYLLYGPISASAWGWHLGGADAEFVGEGGLGSAGSSLAGGDFDCDGYDDILIGANVEDTGGTNAGAVYLIYGSSTRETGTVDLSNADAKFVGENAGDYAGTSVASGDFNGDGCDDILIGAYSETDGDSGAVYLIYGSASGPSGDIDMSSADAKFTGENATDFAGSSVSSAGDVNDDSYDDILIGAPYNDDAGTDAGKAYLILSGF